MGMIQVIECPCCESVSTREEWDELRNGEWVPCPVCENVCTYDEFEEDTFN